VKFTFWLLTHSILNLLNACLDFEQALEEWRKARRIFTGTADELMMAQTYSMKTVVAVFTRIPTISMVGSR